MYVTQLTGFYTVAIRDERLSSIHISVYMALFQYWNLNSFKNPIYITRREVMQKAKVQQTSYHKCMRELHAFGYIKYIPSYHPVLGSQVYIKNLIEEHSLKFNEVKYRSSNE
ncbi:hypothetical protein ESB13_09415 [Filimonas effusa]|uniref:Helix-turn-helix domain-containing protein n=1 Tax=Filimonas effusa TaxID=2508721 RepID=A0A4Q1DC99_9BACT|nr:hypothetical protein ESB13_09415 [Filimonas effusa]